MKVKRLLDHPIIEPHMDDRMGENINGPSLIRVPEWIEEPLGRYYLYFGDHRGTYIRLAYADELTGPWQMYEPGTLALEDSYFIKHLASPDVHVDAEPRRLRMYYHGPTPESGQRTRVALSDDGIHFRVQEEILGAPYMRVFEWDGWYYGLGMPGIFYRSRDGLHHFEKGPQRWTPDMRHTAVLIRDATLYVFYSVAGDRPESILCSTIDLDQDWREWQPLGPQRVLAPETEYEGVALPLEPSSRGPAPGPVRQLRDPAVYCEEGRIYLIYAVAGESGLALAEIEEL